MSGTGSTAATDFALDAETKTVGESLKGLFKRPAGELGAMPALAGLVVLLLLFSIFADKFSSKLNLANLLTQATPVILIAMGVTFVLLLGEIDLSAGYTAGVCVVTMAWLLDKGWSGLIAIPIALIIGVAIGVLTGTLVARVGIPSFVVTLAFFLAFQGIVLLIAREGGTIRVTNDVIIAIANKNLPIALGWVLWALIVAGYLANAMLRTRGRAKHGLAVGPMSLTFVKAGVLAVAWALATIFLNTNRSLNPDPTKKLQGVPIAVPVVLVLVLVLGFLLTRTAWGRHVYAVGGNAEAARRAGIDVARIKISCFVACGLVAAIGGMALASQLASVSPQTGGSDTLLRAVGAAVIGGVSLFGGRGRIYYPVIGGLVVATIDNGLGLLGKVGPVNFSESGPKFIVTGLVLLVAASVDALSRRSTAKG